MVDKELADKHSTGDKVAKNILNLGLPTPPISPPTPSLPFSALTSSSSSLSAQTTSSLPFSASHFPSASTTSPSRNRRQRRQHHLKTPPFLTRNSSSAVNEVAFRTEFFQVKKTLLKGYGAFATKDIEEGTIIMAEAALFVANPHSVNEEIEKLPIPLQTEFLTLAANVNLSDSKPYAIFLTNRYVTHSHELG